MKKLLLLLAIVFSSFSLTSCRDVDSIRKALEEHTIPGATYVGSETCAACHEKATKEMKLSTHARIQIPGENYSIEGCEMCHGPGSIHAESAGEDTKHIINPRKNPERCLACHIDKQAQFKLPHHHPVLEGKMSCSDCHSAHGNEVLPWSATSENGVNEACFKCHKEQRGPFVWGHEAVKDGCSTCHQVHGSVNDKMLIARDSTLCLRCHTQLNLPGQGFTIGKGDHISATSNRMQQGSCFSASCHTAVHGSNFDDHLRY